MSNAINLSVSSLVIGSLTTCQLGNKMDTFGFVSSAEVEVLAVDDKSFLGLRFLVKKVGEEFVALATATRLDGYEEGDEGKAVLQSTNARTYGSAAQSWTGIKTLSEAAKSLGFTL